MRAVAEAVEEAVAEAVGVGWQAAYCSCSSSGVRGKGSQSGCCMRKVTSGCEARSAAAIAAALGRRWRQPARCRCSSMKSCLACRVRVESPRLWDGPRRAPGATASFEAAQAALRGAWEPSDGPGRQMGRSRQTEQAAFLNQLLGEEQRGARQRPAAHEHQRDGPRAVALRRVGAADLVEDNTEGLAILSTSSRQAPQATAPFQTGAGGPFYRLA